MSELKIIPLGGVGEVGALNMMVYQIDNKAIIVDAGAMFPEQDMCGVDLAIPDIRYLVESGVKILGMVLTHGHEDHIGAVPFVVRQIPLKIYASSFARGIIRSKLTEYQCSHCAKLENYDPGDRIRLGPFQIDTIYVNHSFPQVSALVIRTEHGSALHLTDWKIDRESTMGPMTDLDRFAQFRGVDVLLADSTNAGVEGWTRSEKSVKQGLRDMIRQAPGRVIITLFSSNVERIQNIFLIAHELGRKVALVGRSMNENTEIAEKAGLLKIPPHMLIAVDELDEFEPRQVMILASGTQGEPQSAMTRMAMGNHNTVDVRAGDTVLMSSRKIPGNELAIAHVINHLYRRDAIVYQDYQAPIHASGHAYRDEMREIFSLVQPKNFVPIHGDYMHLKMHAQLAEECGVAPDKVWVIENGQTLEIHKGQITRGESVYSGRVLVDGRSVGGVDDLILRDRQHLSMTGMVVCVIMIDKVRGEIVRGPDLVSRGFVGNDPELMEGARDAVLHALKDLNFESMTDWLEVQEKIRLAVRRFFRKTLDRKPMVIPVVLEV